MAMSLLYAVFVRILDLLRRSRDDNEELAVDPCSPRSQANVADGCGHVRRAHSGSDGRQT